MPKLTLVRSVLRPQQREHFTLAPGSTVISWVVNKGFDHNLVDVYVNGDKAPWDKIVGYGDEVLVIVRPGVDPIFWVKIAVAIALSYIAGRLLAKPTNPSSNKNQDPSPTYNISAAQNVARLGGPIPVPYGRVIMTPDYAAQPLVRFEANDQYLEALFCLGSGTIDVLDAIVGQSNASSLPSDVFSYTVYQPNQHGQTFGVIQGQTGVRENTVSSSDVGNQELLAPDAAVSSIPPTFYWKLTAELAGYGGSVVGMIDGNGVGPWYPLMPPLPVLGTTQYVYYDGIVIVGDTETYVRFLNTYVATAWTGGTKVGIIPPYTVTGATGPQWVGPFETCKPGKEGDVVELDFVFPGGLFSVSGGGGFISRTVDVDVELQKIDDFGVAIGPPSTIHESFIALTNTPQRYTRRYTVAIGRYRVRCVRVTNKPTTASTADNLLWYGMKFELMPTITPVYGDVTLVAVQLKAINGISADSSSRIRFSIARKLGDLGVPPLVPTSNPADVLVDIVTARYGGQRPLNAEELDLPTLIDAKSRWDTHNGFNAVFDQRITVWEALQLCLQTVAATPLPIGSTISVAHDCVKDSRVQTFNEANVRNLNINYRFAKVGDPEGVKIQYRNPENFDPSFIEIPPSIESYEEVNLFGCTDMTTAEQYAQYTLNKRSLVKDVTFETEYEGLIALHGDRIGLSHSMPKWGQTGIISSYSGIILVSDVDLDWAGGPHYVLLRDTVGVPHQVGPVTQGASVRHVVCPSLPFTPVPFGEPLEATSFSFGIATRLVTDWVVTMIEPAGDQTVRVSASLYSAAAFTDAMPHQLVALP